MSGASRASVLAAIRPRPGCGEAGEPDPRLRGTTDEPRGGEDRVEGVSRAYRIGGTRSRKAVLDLFSDRVSDYRARLVRASPGDLPRAVSGALAGGGRGSLAVPPDLPKVWLGALPPRSLEIWTDGAEGEPLSREQLDACGGVLTGCAIGIAETGTIVLDGGPTQGRRSLTLLPDYHLCVVFAHQVVETVPEAVAAMGAALRSGRRPFTLISGPSATSDIELVRVEGVHGPRTLEVILVEGDR